MEVARGDASARRAGHRRRVLAASLVAAALGAAGCGDGTPVTTVLLPGAPAEVRDRMPLHFCGEEDVALGGAGADEEARRCLAERWRDGRRAELISTFRTPEGDPITTVFRVFGAGRLQVFEDRTRDRFGSPGRWIARVCRRLEAPPPDPSLGPVPVRASRCEHPPRLI